jgi:diaminohydroxyphosphoribosylaminopyrimidine deaminase/5-amino-6-(5-phosphoribosylamino)uracil reductase
LGSRLAKSVDLAPVTVIVADPEPARVAGMEAAGVEVIVASSPAEALHALGRGGVRSLLVEGGAGLAGSLLEANLVDRLVIFQAPIVLGAGALSAFAAAPGALVAEAPRLEVLERRAFGTDLMTVYAITSI